MFGSTFTSVRIDSLLSKSILGCLDVLFYNRPKINYGIKLEILNFDLSQVDFIIVLLQKSLFSQMYPKINYFTFKSLLW